MLWNNLTPEINKLVELNAPKSDLQIIKEKIKEYIYSEEYNEKLIANRYYQVKNDILHREKTLVVDNKESKVKWAVNQKIAHPFLKTLTEQKLNYLLAKPPTIDNTNNTLNEYFESFFEKMYDLSEDAILKGISWIQFYVEDSKLKYDVIPSEQIIALWSDTAHSKLQSLIRFYQTTQYQANTKKIVCHVEYWTNDGVTYFSGYDSFNNVLPLSNKAPFYIDEIGYKFDRIPFVYLKYNRKEIPLIRDVKAIVDNYDITVSEFCNQVQANLWNSLLVIKNYDGADTAELRKNLASFGILKVSEDGDAKLLDAKSDVAHFNELEKLLRKNIFKHGRGVDVDDNTGRDITNLSIKSRYSELDSDCNNLEKGIRNVFVVALKLLKAFSSIGGFDVAVESEIDIIFNKDNVINESESVDMCAKSMGVISKETIISNHPWTINAKEEYEKLLKETQEEDSYSSLADDNYD